MEPLPPGASLSRIQEYVRQMEIERGLALILLVSIANRCDINLEEAFLAKEARNECRVWV